MELSKQRRMAQRRAANHAREVCIAGPLHLSADRDVVIAAPVLLSRGTRRACRRRCSARRISWRKCDHRCWLRPESECHDGCAPLLFQRDVSLLRRARPQLHESSRHRLLHVGREQCVCNALCAKWIHRGAQCFRRRSRVIHVARACVPRHQHICRQGRPHPRLHRQAPALVVRRRIAHTCGIDAIQGSCLCRHGGLRLVPYSEHGATNVESSHSIADANVDSYSSRHQCWDQRIWDRYDRCGVAERDVRWDSAGARRRKRRDDLVLSHRREPARVTDGTRYWHLGPRKVLFDGGQRPRRTSV